MSLVHETGNSVDHGGGKRNRQRNRQDPGRDGYPPGSARPRREETGADEGGTGARGKISALTVSCDVADRSAVEAAVEKLLKELGSIDILVCNAGTNVRNRSLEKLTGDDWDRMVDVNLTGPFNLVRSVLPGMRERKSGLVIQICSISGIRASTLGGAGYSASKFGQRRWGCAWGAKREQMASARP